MLSKIRDALVFLTVTSATALASEPPRVEHVGLVAPDSVGVTIPAGHVIHGRQVPYTKQAGDAVVPIMGVHRLVRRGGKLIGTLVGKAGETLCAMDEVVGERLDTAWADQPASYRVRSQDDRQYDQPRQPIAVHRKSKPSDLGMIGAFKFACSTRERGLSPVFRRVLVSVFFRRKTNRHQ